MAGNAGTQGGVTQQADPMATPTQQQTQGYVNPGVLKFAQQNPNSLQAQKYGTAGVPQAPQTGIRPTDYFSPQQLGYALDNQDDWQANQQIANVLGSGWRNTPGVIPTAQGWQVHQGQYLQPQSQQDFMAAQNWNSQLTGSANAQNMARMAAAQGYTRGSAFSGGSPQQQPQQQLPPQQLPMSNPGLPNTGMQANPAYQQQLMAQQLSRPTTQYYQAPQATSPQYPMQAAPQYPGQYTAQAPQAMPWFSQPQNYMQQQQFNPWQAQGMMPQINSMPWQNPFLMSMLANYGGMR